VERRIGVLINPSSGAGRVTRHSDEVLRGLGSRGDEVVAIQGESEQHARELVAQAVADGLDSLVAVGGDGTVHLALQAVVGTDIALGIVPLGTGNDGATTVGLGRITPAQAVSVVLAGNSRLFDVGRVQTDDGTLRHFLCVMSSGFDSGANERANAMTWPSGTALYIRAMLAELRSFTPIPYRAVLDGRELVDDAMLVSVGNGPMFGGGMKVCAGADVHDGLLDVVWMHRTSRRKLLAIFPQVYSGRHLADPAIDLHRVGSVRLEAADQVAYADGERIGPLPVTVTSVPDGVRVLIRG
jgi:diacylglycerol kinase (ATP)